MSRFHIYGMYYYSGPICSMNTVTFCAYIVTGELMVVSRWSKTTFLLTDKCSTLTSSRSLCPLPRESYRHAFTETLPALLLCDKMLWVWFLNAVLSILHDRNSRSALFTTFWHWKDWLLCILTLSMCRGWWWGLWVLAMISLHSAQNKWQ